MNNRLLAAAITAGISTGLLQAQETRPAQSPVRADAIQSPGTLPAQQEEAQALRLEISRLRAELEEVRSRQAPAPVKAEPATATQAQSLPQPAAEVTQTATPQPKPAVQPPYANVGVSAVKVTNSRRSGSPGIHVAANITLDGVPNVPFIMQAVLVTPDEQIHTDARSNPYIATREVRTGDDEDTDDYGVFLDLGNLFSSRPPEELFVQVRITDVQGNLVAKSGLHTFRRPWQ